MRDALQYGYKSGDWRAAKLMTKEYTKITGGATATLVGTAYAIKYAKDQGWTDWEIEIDPQKRMFGKAWVIRNGQMVSVDFLPPQMSAPIKQLIQGILGEKNDKGNVMGGRYNRVQSIGNTLEGKYAPLPRIGFGIADSMFASDNAGKDKKPSYPYGTNLDPRTGEGLVNLATSSLAPISMQQEYKTLTSDQLNVGEKIILGLMSLWGRGANVYPVNKK
ncbi:MAG: hypothetical protein IT205_03040 [Fimbriimonadaceae bacterium]|nr:hypothetical protein [Fimbriimonadaceae bacterium]